MSTTSDPNASSATLDPVIVAIVAAAVALTLKRPHRVVSIQESSLQLEAPVYVLNPWSMEGRSQHFGSHKVR